MNNESNFERSRILFWIISISIISLFFKLFQLQIIESKTYERKAENNSIKSSSINSSRGIFFDRNFQVLVGNKPIYQIEIIPAYFDTSNFKLLENLIDLNEDYKTQIIHLQKSYSKYKPIQIKKEQDFERVNSLFEYLKDLPGVTLTTKYVRDYNYKVNGSHVFGYLQEITSSELRKKDNNYDSGDDFGASGIEKSYEDFLRGKKGTKFTVVDSKQRFIKYLSDGKYDIQPQKGNDLVLTIDKQSQILAEKNMQGKKGSVVALDPKTGEIIALVSSPTFDLSILSSATPEEWSAIANHKDKPLFNRATMSTYPPGSTIKPIEALAGLENGFVSLNSKITCNGGLQYGDRFFGCDHVHGKVNLVKSIEESCNTYYYELFLKMGYNYWLKYFTLFGFGQRTNIDIFEESSGLLPDSNFYNKRLGKRRWNSGMLLSLSIGQGEISVTPIQLAKYTALIANNGKTVIPHLVKGFIDSKTNKYNDLYFDKVEIDIDSEKLKPVKKGMELVVNGEGTAENIKDSKIRIAGKTGTAQNPHGDNHAIFISYAPAENPEIVVVVIVENVGYGSTHAAPIAHDIIKSYLRIN